MKRFLSVLMVLCTICPLLGDNRDQVQWWLYYYGDYAAAKGKSDPRVQRVFAVFDRVKETADKAAARLPRLYIIDTKGEPYAVALPDGSIVINPKTLDTCCTGVDETKAGQRLAFILGHELAHLANNDFLHREAFLALVKYPGPKAEGEITPIYKRPDEDKKDELKKKELTAELMADSMGALYASMAGYDIGDLLGKENNFLSFWAGQVEIGNIYDTGMTHPSFKQRLEFTRSRLLAVVEQLELFNAGVLLFQKGNYHDSAAAFEEFAKSFPAGEVFNNIGACYLNLALKRLYEIAGNEYYRFRLSSVIATVNQAESLMQLRGDEQYRQDLLFIRYTGKAVEFSGRAVERDSHSKTARTNLAAALILKGEYARAQAECDQILASDPKDAGALNNKAIAFYYYGKKEDVDTAPKAIRLLHDAHVLYPGHVDILYNLASLKEERDRLAGAGVYWEKYLRLSPWDNYYSYVYKKLKGTLPRVMNRQCQVPVLPVHAGIGEDISILEKKWKSKNAEASKYRIGGEGAEGRQDNESWSLALQVMVRDNVRVVGMDGTVEIVECKIKTGIEVKELTATLGQPGVIVRHSSGNFYVYKDRGFSIKEVNGKIQAYIWFGKEF